MLLDFAQRPLPARRSRLNVAHCFPCAARTAKISLGLPQRGVTKA